MKLYHYEYIRSSDQTAKNKIEATYLVTVRTKFDDSESDEETVRYLLEQDLEEMGWDVDVELQSTKG